LNEAMRLFDENVEEHFLLLTNFKWLPWIHRVNKWKSLIG